MYCKNVASLISYIKEKRQNPNVHLKFGIDGGRGFLKICLSVQDTSINANSRITKPSSEKFKRLKYNDNAGNNDTFKDSGLNKIFILAIAQNCQENYSNVLKLWNILKINDFQGTIATDLKLANLLAGIGSHSSMYPCTYCLADKNNLHVCGVYRTTDNCKKFFEKWRKNGSYLKKAKEYKSCINEPVVKREKNTKIIDIIPPPELHLMIGVVNTLVNHMQQKFEDITHLWIKSCGVERQITHGGSGFNGNSCKDLLEAKNTEKLKKFCEENENDECLKYVSVFESFKDVVDDCFSNELKPTYAESIMKFKSEYLTLNISVTPKVHAVFFHIKDFCAQQKRGLGFFCEQAIESVHFDFDCTWNKYKVLKSNHNYANQLLRAVIEYNSNHI